MAKSLQFFLFVGLFIVLSGVSLYYLCKALQKRRRKTGTVIGIAQTPSGIQFEIIADLFSVIGIFQWFSMNESIYWNVLHAE